jgi:hypothetical protein
VIYANGANTLTQLAKDTNSTRYLSNTGTSNNPAWAQVNLANGVTGTLPPANVVSTTAYTGTAQSWTANQTFSSATVVAGGLYINPNIKTANYTVTSTDTIIVASGTITITMPSLTAGTSQQVIISKINLSTQPVNITFPSGLVAGVTNYVQLFAPGQSAEFYSDGTNWNVKKWPLNQPYIGTNAEPNSANVVVASTVYCYAYQATDFYGGYAIGFDAAAQALQSQVGFYDYSGNVISTSAFTTIGTGFQKISLAKVGYGAPGVVWVCFGSQSATTSLTRYSTGSAIKGACSFANGLPLPTTETFAGCTVPSLSYALQLYVGGSNIP